MYYDGMSGLCLGLVSPPRLRLQEHQTSTGSEFRRRQHPALHSYRDRASKCTARTFQRPLLLPFNSHPLPTLENRNNLSEISLEIKLWWGSPVYLPHRARLLSLHFCGVRQCC